MQLMRFISIVCFLSLLVGCQNQQVIPTKPVVTTQLRATLNLEQGQWVATDCSTKARFQLKDGGNIDFATDAEQLLPGAKGSLFIDVIGHIDTKADTQTIGSFVVKKINRLTLDAKKGCAEPDYNQVIVRSVGKNPLWFTSIAIKGLVLERINHDPLVLPYVEERLQSGQMNFATKANNQRIELWVAPERCIDVETNEIYSMVARLAINYQVFYGCAYLGKVGFKP